MTVVRLPRPGKRRSVLVMPLTTSGTIAERSDKLTRTKGAVLTTYSGLSVAQDTKLRRKLREAEVEYRVVKNTLTRIAAAKANITGLDKHLEGTTAIAISYTDPVAPAKVLSEFVKELKGKNLEIKAGIVEGKVIDANGVKSLASLPSREVLLAQLLAGMQSPIVGLVNVLHGTTRNLVCALEAIRKQKESA
ncbi:MAG: rplJ [Anaerosporomusa subterranea]|nr:rplJ [Anaerosporomusa subterranea]